MNWNPVSEHQAGVLCSKGFMKERYDNYSGEFIRTFTKSGVEVVKNILKEDKYKKEFMIILFNELKGLEKNSRIQIVNELRRMLNEI